MDGTRPKTWLFNTRVVQVVEVTLRPENLNDSDNHSILSVDDKTIGAVKGIMHDQGVVAKINNGGGGAGGGRGERV